MQQYFVIVVFNLLFFSQNKIIKLNDRFIVINVAVYKKTATIQDSSSF